MDKRSIMTLAWTIARDGAARFGGSARDYIGDALRMAWTGLVGTARQIAWALKLRREAHAALDALAAAWAPKCKDDADRALLASVVAGLKARREAAVWIAEERIPAVDVLTPALRAAIVARA